MEKYAGLLWTIALLACICALAGCGTEGTTATEPSLSVSSMAPKQLLLVWDTWFGATHYDVKCSPDGSSTFLPTTEGTGQTDQTHREEIAVHLTDWDNCQYMVEAFNESRSSRVPYGPQALNQGMSTGAIGYLKAPQNEVGDRCGSSVALSQDGKTLAIGAEGEDSSATGVNGDQSDNSASGAGAVYLY